MSDYYDAVDEPLETGEEELTLEQKNAIAAERRKREQAAKQKDVNAKLKRLEELEAKEAKRAAEERTATVAETFTALGLPPKLASLYQGDSAEEADVKAWAREMELLVPEPEEAEDEKLLPFKPFTMGSSTPASGTMSIEEAVVLAKSDPAAAQKAYTEGRVVDANGHPIGRGR